MKSIVKIGVPAKVYDDLIEHPDIGSEKLLPYPLWKYPPEWHTSAAKNMRELGEFFKKGDARRSSYIQCPSVSNIIKKSIVVSSLFDLKISSSGGKLLVDEDTKELTDKSHTKNQHEQLTGGRYENVKVALPYYMMAGKTQQLVLNLPPELHESYYKTRMWTNFGMFPYSRKMSMQTNTFWPVYEDYEETIPAGTPLNYLTFPNLKSKVDVEYVRIADDYPTWAWIHRKASDFILK